MDLELGYKPLEWQQKAHQSKINNQFCVGGLGSAKTTYAIRELQACALNNPKGLYLIGRATLPSLRDTTYRSFFQHTEPQLIKSHNKANLVVTLINDAEFIFRPLDDPEKFKSLEISGFFLDEVNEISEDMYQTIRSRVRQTIDKRVPFYRTIAAMNPEDETHWVAQRCLYKKPNNEEIIFSSTFENKDNLPPGYINELKSMYTEDMQKRMIYGQFGRVFKGNPVFPQFARGHFVRPIDPIDKYPLYRGIDFGYNKPAVCWLQYVDGQIRIYHAIKGEKIYLDDFMRDVVLPKEHELFGNWRYPIKTICDPAGAQESDKGKTSVEILQDFGIFPMYKKTRIEEGIKAIKHFLDTKAPNGDPNLLVHPRADMLIAAWKGGYCWDDKMQSPDKTKGYDDVSDAARYPITYIHKWARAGAMNDNFNNRRMYVSKGGSRSFEY
jgi:hypothetical protein